MTDSELGRELESLAHLVGSARGSLAEGKSVELASIETRVEALCNALGAAPRPAAQSFRAPLIAFIDELDKLAGELRARQVGLRDELTDLTDRRRAAAAYGRGAGTRKP